ncbi:type I 3-dehydroquinate dehydratase [Bilifractor sp. LCP19S3_H10]|uniref:type I 3-dehydroquinate dehydratase n=1 Tax=Bilifractor sp. LCP19S3_H10 TaxID=3438736 RepID=UPI003F929DE4
MAEGQNTVDEKESTAGRDEESLSCGNSAEMNLEKKTPEEYSENVKPSEEMNVTAEEPADHEPAEAESERQKEGENIRSVDDENGLHGENKNGLHGENKNELPGENENTLSGEKSVEKTDDPEAEKDADVRSDHRGQEMRRNKVHEKKQRSLYEWRREKPAKSPKPLKAVKKPVHLKNGVILGEGLPKICVPLTGTGKDELEAQAREAAAASPDLVEWRADYFEDLGDVEKVAEVLVSLQEILGETPILFTIRTKREGGNGQLTPEEYRSLLLYAAGRPEVSLVDIEGLNPEINTELLISEVHQLGMPVIASWHNFSRTPKKPELGLVFDRLSRTGADVLKVAVMPKKAKDVLRLMSVTEEKNRQFPSPLVTMAMGDLGRLSRVSGRITGSAMTFGIVGDASAPGQLPVEELREMLRAI